MGKFDFKTIQNFDSHINNSVSNYGALIGLIKEISPYFITNDSITYDIGCSTGKLLLELSSEYKNASFVGYDISDNLLPKIFRKNINFYNRDINDQTLKFINTNLVLSVFTLQFIEIEKRYTLVKKIYDSLNKGGAFIVAEKIYIEKGIFQEIFTFSHYAQKGKSFSSEEILKKQKDLRFIMKPLSESDNEKMFKECGFKKVESFYQSLNFKAWILIK